MASVAEPQPATSLLLLVPTVLRSSAPGMGAAERSLPPAPLLTPSGAPGSWPEGGALLSLSLHSQTSGKLTFPGDLLVTVPANAVYTCMHVPCCPWHPVCRAITCLQASALSGGGGVVPLPGGAGSQVKPPGPSRQITNGARAWA